MPFSGYPLVTTFTNESPNRDVHPAAHNVVDAAVNDVQDQITALTGQIPLNGTGSPEGVVTATVGNMYLRTDGGTNTTLYVKETGAGNTGWVANVAGAPVGGDAGTLSGQTLAQVRTLSTHTGTLSADLVADGSTNKAYTATEKTKLADVAINATANATDAQLRDRSTHTGLDVPATPAPSTEVAYSQITADITGIVIDTLNLDAVSGLNVVVPDLATIVHLDAKVSLSHSVINANVIVGIALSSATIVTGLLAASFQNLNAIGTKGTGTPTVRLAAHSPGTYQVFILGDAGTAAIRAATYYPSYIRAMTG